MSIYVLHDRCKELLAPPFNFSGKDSLDEEKLYEALSPLFECLHEDDTIDGFIKWVMVPLVVAFGTAALSEAGRQRVQGKEEKIAYLSRVFRAEKETFLAGKGASELVDDWDYVKFVNKDIASTGLAFLHAFKFKRIKL